MILFEVSIEEDEIEISTLGVGAQGGEEGRRRYHFVIEFFLPIDTENSKYVKYKFGFKYYNNT